MYDDKFRDDFRADVSKRIANVGGWGIDLGTAAGDTGGQTTAEPTTAASLNGSLATNSTTATSTDKATATTTTAQPRLVQELELAGADTPVRVVDDALPMEWCEKFIKTHTAAGFTPQHVLDKTVGSPQQMLIRKLFTDLQASKQKNAAIAAAAARDGAGGTKDYDVGKNTSEVLEVVSPELAAAMWRRVEAFIPPVIHTPQDSLIAAKGDPWTAAAIVPVFRFMRYTPGQAFKPHTDPSRLRDVHPVTGTKGRFKSLVTLAFYLNDSEEFVGGGLHFVRLVPNPNRLEGTTDTNNTSVENTNSSSRDTNANGEAQKAKMEEKASTPALVTKPVATLMPKRGRCVVFEHRRLHESETIVEGTKYMVQCDVLYEWSKKGREEEEEEEE